MARAAACVVVLAAMLLSATSAAAQSCPEPLASTRRLVLVTADNFSTPEASMRMYARSSSHETWKLVSASEPAQLGRTGLGWSYFFRAAARPGEPIKIEGDRRAPAGFFRIGKSFGLVPSSRAGYTRLTEGVTCIHDLSSPAYNTITTRAAVGMSVRGENMWRVPEYKRGLFVDYPTDARARAGSCIFIHLRLPEKAGTGGCVALPEARIEALQNFSEPGAVLAILPKAALPRFGACLPAN
jgi:L,D-peptidoglycan transpeptidase YkuD (ErfK/YbiS/YcfS/YnhG family)